MKGANTYFKSLTSVDGGLGTKTYNSETEVREKCQDLDEMLNLSLLKANTSHSSLPDRLCVSQLNRSYSGSYRPSGVIFQTEQKPSYCAPVDLMVLTDGESFTSSDYSSKFIDDSDLMIFNSVDEMLKNYETPNDAKKTLNKLRYKAGLSETGEFLYNECCFENTVEIKPVGLVGTSPEIIEMAEKYDLPIYTSTESYVRLNETIESEKPDSFSFLDFFRKSSVGALYRVGASFAMDALAIGIATGELQSFFEDLEPAKLLRISAYVVGINFMDYKFDVTNRLDSIVRRKK